MGNFFIITFVYVICLHNILSTLVKISQLFTVCVERKCMTEIWKCMYVESFRTKIYECLNLNL